MEDKLELLKKNLIIILDADNGKSIKVIANHIAWELVGDFDNKYTGLEDQYRDVSLIAELAIELSDDYYELDDDNAYFNQMVDLIHNLSPDKRN